MSDIPNRFTEDLDPETAAELSHQVLRAVADLVDAGYGGKFSSEGADLPETNDRSLRQVGIDRVLACMAMSIGFGLGGKVVEEAIAGTDPNDEDHAIHALLEQLTAYEQHGLALADAHPESMEGGWPFPPDDL